MRSFEQEINETQEWFDSPRFEGIVRLYTARQVVEQRGTIGHDYTDGARGGRGVLRSLARAFRASARASPPSARTRRGRRWR